MAISGRLQAAGILMLIMAAVMWGGSFVVVKDSLDYTTPLWQLTFRLAVAALGGIPLFITQLKHIKGRYIFQGVVLGLLFAFALIPQNYGARLTTASKCAFLTVSYVAFVPVFGALLFKEKLTLKKLGASAICMVGVGLITLTEGFSLAAGDIFLLITGMFYALHIIWIDKSTNEENAIIIHVVQIWTALVVALVAAVLIEPFKFAANSSFILGITYCGIFEVLVGFLLQLKGQQYTSPSLAGIILSMECVFAAVFGVALQGDTFSTKMAVGSLLILVSAVMEAVEGK